MAFPGYTQRETAINLESFKRPSGLNRPLTWWHWINGNVTKEGIKKDLIDMKRVGIGGVQLFDTHMYLPKGPVRYGSDSWHEHVQYAIRICDSLGLEFYIVNSPGWSGAGGPWIDVNRSMKTLVFSETQVSTSEDGEIKLSQPYSRDGLYEDIAVLAVREGGSKQRRVPLAFRSVDNNRDIDALSDRDLSTSWTSSKGGDTLVATFDGPTTLNGIRIDLKFLSVGTDFRGSIAISKKGHQYESLATFAFPNHSDTTGSFVIPFEAVSTRKIRISLTGTRDTIQVAEVEFRLLHSPANWHQKIASTKFPVNETVAANIDRKVMFNEEGLMVKDVTRFFDRRLGVLKWTPTDGVWTILRFGYTTTGKKIHPAQDEGTGYEVDKLDPEAVRFQFEKSLGRIIRDAGDLAGKTFKGIVFDSFEGGYQNWTSELPELFEAKKGYSLIPYLPLFAGRMIGGEKVAEGILWDFRQCITELIAENYQATMYSLAKGHGLSVYAESQGGPISPAWGNRYSDVPMNEFWTDGIERRIPLIRQTVSAAHILGKPIVGAEAFTSKPEFGKWQRVPANLKQIGDVAFAAGINRFVFHTYTHQPYDVYPGFTMGRYGTHFGRTNTWWAYARPWMEYIARSQYLLQWGQRHADICVLYPEDAIYEEPPGLPVIPSGYTFDICYPHQLEDIQVQGGKLIFPSGANYRIMVLAPYPVMHVKTLHRLADLLDRGATIVGPPPHQPAGRNDLSQHAQFGQLVDRIWGGLDGKGAQLKEVGTGKVHWNNAIVDMLKNSGIRPDIESDDDDSLMFAHRYSETEDVYFVVNRAEQSSVENVEFSVPDKRPEIWDPNTGDYHNAPIVDTSANGVNVRLGLAPGASRFVVFRKPLPENWVREAEKDVSGQSNPIVTVLKNKWDLLLVDEEKAITLDSLRLWNTFHRERIKYYSGPGIYSTTFKLRHPLDEDDRIFLDIGAYFDLAQIDMNGQKVGIMWDGQGMVDITSHVKKGLNQLQITVVNRWVNRLIGDEHYPTTLRYAVSNSIFSTGRLLELPHWLQEPANWKTKRKTFTTWKHYQADSPLVPSGLAGPVRLLHYRK